MKPISPSHSILILSLAAFVLAATSPASACSDCGCSLSSDWAALGYDALPGFELGLRFDYADQTELYSGADHVDHASLVLPNDAEIQQRTLNRTTWLDFNYAVSSTWAITASVPYHDRFHTTIAEGDTDISTSRASGLGDTRLLARYQNFSLGRSYGLLFGLKLPTGRFDQNFSDGPQAGELLDRGLQLGSGTTDLVLGASWFTRLEGNVGGFISATLQQPLAERADFLPSTTLNLSGGVRWQNASRFTPQLQLNLKAESREHGAEGDTANSGGTFAYLSPGLTASIGAHSNAYLFVQLPVYQRVNGLQLEPRWLFSAGWRIQL